MLSNEGASFPGETHRLLEKLKTDLSILLNFGRDSGSGPRQKISKKNRMKKNDWRGDRQVERCVDFLNRGAPRHRLVLEGHKKTQALGLGFQKNLTYKICLCDQSSDQSNDQPKSLRANWSFEFA